MSNNTANATYNLGRVGMNLRGEYDPAAAYEPLDTVTWRGGSYAARVAATGIAPSAEDTWMPLAQGLSSYDTKERYTGRHWIDGKPIYERTVIFKTPATVNASIEHPFDFSGMDRVWVDTAGTVMERRDGLYVYHAGYVANDAGRQFMVNPRPNNGIIMIVSDAEGTAYVSLFYTKTTDAPTYYHLPYLTADSDQECVVTASSEFSNLFKAFYAFGGATINQYWVCAAADAERWIQVQMPYKLKNMAVQLTSPKHGDGIGTNRLPVAGTFLGSNDGAAWTQIGTFADRPAQMWAVTQHTLANAVGYKYLRIQITQPGTGEWTGFGDIRIQGEIEA